MFPFIPNGRVNTDSVSVGVIKSITLNSLENYLIYSF